MLRDPLSCVTVVTTGTRAATDRARMDEHSCISMEVDLGALKIEFHSTFIYYSLPFAFLFQSLKKKT